MRYLLGITFSAALGFLMFKILATYAFYSDATVFLFVLLGLVVFSISTSMIIIFKRLNSVSVLGNPDFVSIFHILQVFIIIFSIVFSIWNWELRVPMVVLTTSAFLLWHFTGGCPFTDLEIALRKSRGETHPAVEQGFASYNLKKIFRITVSENTVAKGLYLIAFLLFSWYIIDFFV